SDTSSLHVLSEVAMGGPGSSDHRNSYQQQTEQSSAGNPGINTSRHSGPSLHSNMPSTSTTPTTTNPHTNTPYAQYPSTSVPLAPPLPPHLQQPSTYPQYEQQQHLHETVPPPLFDENGNPIGMTVSP